MTMDNIVVGLVALSALVQIVEGIQRILKNSRHLHWHVNDGKD